MPALTHEFGAFAVKSAKISKLTSDPAAGPSVYAASVRVPGIRSCEMSGTVKSESLYGDMTILNVFSVLESIKLTVEHAKLSTDALAVLLGGAVVDAGTPPNQTSTYTPGTQFNQFKFEAQCTATDQVGGDVHIVIPKLILDVLPKIGFANGAWEIWNFSAIGVTPNAAGSSIFQIVENEILVPIG